MEEDRMVEEIPEREEGKMEDETLESEDNSSDVKVTIDIEISKDKEENEARSTTPK